MKDIANERKKTIVMQKQTKMISVKKFKNMNRTLIQQNFKL